MPLFAHRFVISGLNLERFLNLMKQQEIPLFFLRRPNGRTLVCECRSLDLKRISALVQEKGWRMEEIQPVRLSAFLMRMKKRPGIPAGIVLALIGLMVVSQFIWRVQISGAGAYHAEMVSFLQESGYHAGVRKDSVDAKALESALVYRYPDIAWFHVYVTNVTLVVDVSHGVPVPEKKGSEPGDLVAARDGIVRAVQVFAGTAKVGEGDIVRKGDVLIQGQERAADGQFVPVRAQGTVTARCWDSFTVHVPAYEVVSTETGRQSTAVRIHTPWFDYPQQMPEPAFLAYNTSVKQLPLVGAFFPVWLQKAAFSEVSMEYALRNMDEVRQEAGQAALRELKNALFDDEIIDKWVDYCMIEDDTLAATVTAERLVDIGAFLSP